MQTAALLPAGEVLAAMERLLDQVDPARARIEPEVRLAWVRLARRVHSRVGALASVLVGEAQRVQAAERTAGTPLSSWLGMGETLSRREASGAVAQATALAGHPELGAAGIAGRVDPGQLRSMVKVLDGLAPQLQPDQQVAAEHVMIGLADHLDAEQLSRAAGEVLAQVVPAAAEELLETRLQREHEAAWRNRSLRILHDGASVRFDGSVPRVEGERFLALLDAHREAQRRTALEARDPAAEFATPEQRRADAFIALLHASANTAPAPGVGAARVLVKLDFQRLRSAAAGAGLIGEDQPVSAGELRRLCCDADLVPVVLNSASEVLDVGRSVRLVTPAIRTALTVRDGGCAFPGCRVSPRNCEAHHITPWWAGGVTALSNLTLLCHTHHAVIEPAKYGLRDQWHVEIGADGRPQFIPPARLDRLRRARTPSRGEPDDPTRRSIGGEPAEPARGPFAGKPAGPAQRPITGEPAATEASGRPAGRAPDSVPHRSGGAIQTTLFQRAPA